MSKRRTFHVDWDSPSDATGTVRRRHTTPVTISKEFFVKSKNPEPAKGRRLSGSFSTKISSIDIGDSSEGRRSNEKIQRAPIEDNGGSLKRPSAQGARKKDPFYKHESLEKFRKELRVRRGKIEASDFKEQLSSPQEVTFAERKSRDFSKEKLFSDMKSSISEIPFLKDSSIQEKIEEERLKINLQEASSETNFSKMAVRREFGLKLSKNQLEWKSKSKSKSLRKIKNLVKSPISPGEASSRSETAKPISGIPRPKIVRSTSKPRGLVNSSSESSGIGSPLSPLSPQKDSNVSGEREVDGGGIRTSESKSSGLGSPDSPDSPLSPDSQQYTAFYLIQQQLEKLHNCSCERRQAQVTISSFTCNVLPKRG